MKGKGRLKVVTKTEFLFHYQCFASFKVPQRSVILQVKNNGKRKIQAAFLPQERYAGQNGKSPIMGRISAGSSMVQFSCKCSCTPRLWDSRKNRLLGKSAEAVSVNKELDRLQVSIHKVYESLSGKSDAPITAERVRELVFGLNSESQDCCIIQTSISTASVSVWA